jgi:hypothetical protein
MGLAPWQDMPGVIGIFFIPRQTETKVVKSCLSAQQLQ